MFCWLLLRGVTRFLIFQSFIPKCTLPLVLITLALTTSKQSSLTFVRPSLSNSNPLSPVNHFVNTKENNHGIILDSNVGSPNYVSLALSSQLLKGVTFHISLPNIPMEAPSLDVRHSLVTCHSLSTLQNASLTFLAVSSLFKIPSSMGIKIEKLQRDFLWSKVRAGKRDHLIS